MSSPGAASVLTLSSDMHGVQLFVHVVSSNCTQSMAKVWAPHMCTEMEARCRAGQHHLKEELVVFSSVCFSLPAVMGYRTAVSGV